MIDTIPTSGQEDDVQGFLGATLIVCGGPLIGVIAGWLQVQQPPKQEGGKQVPAQPRQ